MDPNEIDPARRLLMGGAATGLAAAMAGSAAAQNRNRAGRRQQGVRVNAVAPGPIWTPLQPSGGQTPDKLPAFGQDTPMGRPGQPAELASIYVLLASQESSYATGQVYGASGGSGQP